MSRSAHESFEDLAPAYASRGEMIASIPVIEEERAVRRFFDAYRDIQCFGDGLLTAHSLLGLMALGHFPITPPLQIVCINEIATAIRQRSAH